MFGSGEKAIRMVTFLRTEFEEVCASMITTFDKITKWVKITDEQISSLEEKNKELEQRIKNLERKIRFK